MVYTVNFNISEKYAEYICYNCIYELAFNIDKFNYALREQEKLYNQFFASEAKNIRFRKLFYANREKFRKFDSRKNRNIKKLEKLEQELKGQEKIIVSGFSAKKLLVVSDLELGQ